VTALRNSNSFQWGTDCQVHKEQHRCSYCEHGLTHWLHRCYCSAAVAHVDRADAMAKRNRRQVGYLLMACVYVATTVHLLMALIVFGYAVYAVTRPVERYRPVSRQQLVEQVAQMRERGEWW
jgi:hypothetical protein